MTKVFKRAAKAAPKVFVNTGRPGGGGESGGDPVSKVLQIANDLYNESEKQGQEIGGYFGGDFNLSKYTTSNTDRTIMGLPFNPQNPLWDNVMGLVHTHLLNPNTNAVPDALSDNDIAVSKALYQNFSNNTQRGNLYQYAVTPRYIIQYQNGNIIKKMDRKSGQIVE